MRLAYLLALVSIAYADQCTVSEWGPWSKCTASKRCMAEPMREALLQTFHKEETNKWDIGRFKMNEMIKIKTDRAKHVAACRADGSCPEMAYRPSSGFVACSGGYADDLPCSNIDQMYFMNFDDQGYEAVATDSNPEGNDIWGWTDSLNNDEYAIMGLTGATTFVRVTDPLNPVAAGVLYTETTASTWRDIKVIGDYAYIVSEARGHGLQVFDLKELRGSNTAKRLETYATNRDFGKAHNIVANEATNYVYVVGANQLGYPQSCSGLMAIDVSNPKDPVTRGCYSADGYTHDAQCVIYNGPDTAYQGKEICFAYNEDSFTIVDVTDKSNMVMISKKGYAGSQYTHQGWVTDDHKIALLDDEMDENGQANDYTKTYIWDIENLNDPKLVEVYQSSETSIDHNQYIVGDLVFQANYESGLRILNFDRQSNQLTQVAYFDVFPSRTSAQFYGSWSVYPYFASGNVVVSSIDYGLFVLRPDYNAIQSMINSKKVFAKTTRSRQILDRAAGASCPPLHETKVCEAFLYC